MWSALLSALLVVTLMSALDIVTTSSNQTIMANTFNITDKTSPTLFQNMTSTKLKTIKTSTNDWRCKGIDTPMAENPCFLCHCRNTLGEWSWPCRIMDCMPLCVDGKYIPGQCCPSCPNGYNCLYQGVIIKHGDMNKQGERCFCESWLFATCRNDSSKLSQLASASSSPSRLSSLPPSRN